MQTLSRRQIRYRQRQRAPMRDFSMRGMVRWLRRSRIEHAEQQLADGRVRVWAFPTLPVDRHALQSFGFSWSAVYGGFYRTAERAR